MRPRLQAILPPDRGRETARPLPPRIMPHHVLDRARVHELRVTAHVVCPRYQRGLAFLPSHVGVGGGGG